MNWPHIIIGAGISAWLHAFAAAACESLGLHAFAQFGLCLGTASALTFVIGLIVRAVVESNQDEARMSQQYNEKLKTDTERTAEKFEAWRRHLLDIDERLRKVEKAPPDSPSTPSP